mmetsp:Transcript_4157/g.8350  ORF Transcript_4157/g.8350 Transcript_4157/m.8350 type:complete len:136 (-) Transcript_4157:51-458(-)
MSRKMHRTMSKLVESILAGRKMTPMFESPPMTQHNVQMRVLPMCDTQDDSKVATNADTSAATRTDELKSTTVMPISSAKYTMKGNRNRIVELKTVLVNTATAIAEAGKGEGVHDWVLLDASPDMFILGEDARACG